MLIKQESHHFLETWFYREFWQIANGVLNKGKSAIPPLFSGMEMLSPTSDKVKLFGKIFSRYCNLDESGIYGPVSCSRI